MNSSKYTAAALLQGNKYEMNFAQAEDRNCLIPYMSAEQLHQESAVKLHDYIACTNYE